MSYQKVGWHKGNSKSISKDKSLTFVKVKTNEVNNDTEIVSVFTKNKNGIKIKIKIKVLYIVFYHLIVVCVFKLHEPVKT